MLVIAGCRGELKGSQLVTPSGRTYEVFSKQTTVVSDGSILILKYRASAANDPIEFNRAADELVELLKPEAEQGGQSMIAILAVVSGTQVGPVTRMKHFGVTYRKQADGTWRKSAPTPK
jgi:hypothetical protein